MKTKFITIIKKESPFLFLAILIVVAGLFVVSKHFYLKVKGAVAVNYPAVIWDEQKRIDARTESLETGKILADAGITVYPEDLVSRDLIKDPVAEGGLGQKITIARAPVFHVNVDGTTIVIRSWEKTIGKVIEGKVNLGPKDILSPLADSAALPGEINITRINIVETDQIVPINFTTTYQDDYFVVKGKNQKVVAGVNGQKKQYLKITYRNGAEVTRVVTGSETVANPINEVIKRGLMPSSHRDFNRNYWNIMVSAGQKYGVSPLDLFQVAACESHVNPNSSGTYLGMYQYTSGFWNQASAAAGFGGAAWNDATAQINTTAYWVSKYGWGRWGCKP